MKKEIQELKNCWEELKKVMLPGKSGKITDGLHLGMFSVHGNRIDYMNDCFSKINIMNIEKQIAQTIIDAQKMREESYKIPEGCMFGEYKLDIETCLKTAGEKNGLSSNMWYLLSLAMHWWNDIQLWAENIIAGKNIENEVLTPDDIEAIIHDEGIKPAPEPDGFQEPEDMPESIKTNLF